MGALSNPLSPFLNFRNFLFLTLRASRDKMGTAGAIPEGTGRPCRSDDWDQPPALPLALPLALPEALAWTLTETLTLSGCLSPRRWRP